MKSNILSSIDRSALVIGSLAQHADRLAEICDLVVQRLQAGNKVLTAGHGGSAAEALHMAEELVGRFKADRRSLPAVSLVADSTLLTCIGNDFGFERLFSRQVEGLGSEGDLLVIFSTSGQGNGFVLAAQAAKAKGMKTVALLGRDGGPFQGIADLELIVDDDETARIQEAHQVVMHIILEAVERAFV